jgi:hypothetical protein
VSQSAKCAEFSFGYAAMSAIQQRSGNSLSFRITLRPPETSGIAGAAAEMGTEEPEADDGGIASACGLVD